MLFTGRLFIIKDSLHTISVYPACEARGRKEFRMNIFSLFTLCGGLAFFLYGMTVMSKSLEKMAGGKPEERNLLNDGFISLKRDIINNLNFMN